MVEPPSVQDEHIRAAVDLIPRKGTSAAPDDEILDQTSHSNWSKPVDGVVYQKPSDPNSLRDPLRVKRDNSVRESI